MVTSTITFHKRFDMINGVVSERKSKYEYDFGC